MSSSKPPAATDLPPTRIAQFYQRSVPERLALLRERGLLTAADEAQLTHGGQVLGTAAAERLVENVIGVFGLPLGLGLNFVVDGRPFIVPMVVEEASIVAGVSASAKLAAQAGGFRTRAEPSLMIGQVQVVNLPDPEAALARLEAGRQSILDLANSLHPKMVARGGGARGMEVHRHPAAGGGQMLVVHLLVDTCDAMGANLVNTMCEGVAALVEALSGGKVGLRILSNLTDRAVVHAEVRLPPALLGQGGYSGENVRDRVIEAGHFAATCPYRAATHNKGIMNGVDAVALATGNDWRAIEAAAHAYAARSGRYTALTEWTKDSTGALRGTLALPLKVGTVGGNLQANPAVALAQRLLRVGSAAELARVMAAVGLAQNFAALRALATTGIQAGHMTLHARAVVASLEVPGTDFDEVVDRLAKGGQVKAWRAQEIAREVAAERRAAPRGRPAPARHEAEARGHGKLLLLGEHAVVYGSHALAAPMAVGVRARIEDTSRDGVHLVIPAWGVEGHLGLGDRHNALHVSLWGILEQLALTEAPMTIHVEPEVPRAMGLGGSAALAVAVIRALSLHFRLGLTDAEVDRLAFASEQVAHGNPSGVDNAVATYGRLLLFRRGTPASLRPLAVPARVPVVLGISGHESLTAKMVAQVRQAWCRHRALYDGMFKHIDQLARAGADAVEAGNWELLGELMNLNQGLLNGLQVSTGPLETLIDLARRHGAVGAKLTGSGGGGSMVALVPDDPERVATAMRRAGFRALVSSLGPAA